MLSVKRRFSLLLLAGRVISAVCGTVFIYYFLYYESIDLRIDLKYIGLYAFIFSSLIFITTEGLLAKLVSTGEYDKRVRRFAYFLIIFYIILFPFIFTMDVLLSALIKDKDQLSEKEDEFMELVKSESESGVIKKEEKDMIESIFDFSDTTVKEIMIPRIDVVAVDKNISINELIEIYKKEGHSRIPVYNERIDNILGVIYAKDLLINISEKGKNTPVTEIMRKPYFVPETKKTSELLKELKKKKIHLAIVVDEYGGTAGIIALEDLIEEIIGEIQDEYDSEEKNYQWLDDRNMTIDAGISINDFNDILRTDIPSENVDTLAGFIYNYLGRIPENDEEIIWNNLTFRIIELNGNRISKVNVFLNEPEIKDENENKQ
jgi:putative hemolysin